jgi:hypothetical protein
LFVNVPSQRLDDKLQEKHNLQTQITKGKKHDTKNKHRQRIEEYLSN